MESILSQRIKELCEQRGITLQKLCEACELSESVIRKWANSNSPSVRNVKKVAEFFNVSVDYLIGLSDIPERSELLLDDADILSLQRARSKMSAYDRERMMQMLRLTFDKAFQDDQDDD